MRARGPGGTASGVRGPENMPQAKEGVQPIMHHKADIIGPGADLRSRRRMRTAETIRKAALRLVVARGLDNVTTEMIAHEAGISLRTFFNYFAFKEEALMPAPIDFAPEAVAGFIHGSGSLLSDITTLLLTRFDHVEEDRAQLRVLFQISQTHPKLVLVRDKAFQQYEEEIGRLIARRLGLDPEQDRPRLMAAVLAAGIKVAMSGWVLSEQGTAASHVRSTLAALENLFVEDAA